MRAEIEIRSLTNEDEPYIFSSWLKHYKNSKFAKNINPGIYFRKHHAIIHRILHAENSTVNIANPRGEPEVILGYIVYQLSKEKPVIHFTYVKPAFRRMGIARALTKEINLKNATFTHWTKDIDWIFGVSTWKDEKIVFNPGKIPSILYDPYLI